MDCLYYPIIIPLIAGAVILIIPEVLKGIREAVALIGTVLTAYYAGLIYFAGKEVSSSYLWFRLEDFVFSADLRVDGLSGLILFAAAFFAVLIVVYSIGFMKDKHRLKEYYIYLLLTCAAASTAAACAGSTSIRSATTPRIRPENGESTASARTPREYPSNPSRSFFKSERRAPLASI